LLVVLDATIVNIAAPRPSATSASPTTSAMGGHRLRAGLRSLLLLGGRIADLFGRKWTYRRGACSASPGVRGRRRRAELRPARLGPSRAGQFAAMLAPAALSLLTTTFTDPAERGKAFGVYAAIAGTGGAFGLRSAAR
jgi:hypothetical protein